MLASRPIIFCQIVQKCRRSPMWNWWGRDVGFAGPGLILSFLLRKRQIQLIRFLLKELWNLSMVTATDSVTLCQNASSLSNHIPTNRIVSQCIRSVFHWMIDMSDESEPWVCVYSPSQFYSYFQISYLLFLPKVRSSIGNCTHINQDRGSNLKYISSVNVLCIQVPTVGWAGL